MHRYWRGRIFGMTSLPFEWRPWAMISFDEKVKGSVISNQIGLKFGFCSSIEYSWIDGVGFSMTSHSQKRRPWRHFKQQSLSNAYIETGTTADATAYASAAVIRPAAPAHRACDVSNSLYTLVSSWSTMHSYLLTLLVLTSSSFIIHFQYCISYC